MRIRPRPLVVVATASLLAMGLTACGGDETADAPSATTETDAGSSSTAPTETQATTGTSEAPVEMTDVSFSAVPSTTSIALQVAADQGFFEEEGINAEIVTFTSGSASEQAMLTGEVDFGGGGVGNSLLIESAGEGVTNLALFQERPIFTFVVREDLADEITSVEDLEGRIVGISSPGSLTDFFARLTLMSAGLDPDSDVDLVGTGGPSGHLAAMEADQVEVQLTWEPGTTQLTEITGAGEILLDLRTDDAPPEIQALVGSSLQALDSTVEADPELAEAVTRAVVKADKAIADDPAVLAESLAGLFTELPPEQVDRIAELEHSAFRPSITEEEVQAWVDAYLELGFLEESLDPGSVLDDRFTPLWGTE